MFDVGRSICLSMRIIRAIWQYLRRGKLGACHAKGVVSVVKRCRGVSVVTRLTAKRVENRPHALNFTGQY